MRIKIMDMSVVLDSFRRQYILRRHVGDCDPSFLTSYASVIFLSSFTCLFFSISTSLSCLFCIFFTLLFLLLLLLLLLLHVLPLLFTYSFLPLFFHSSHPTPLPSIFFFDSHVSFFCIFFCISFNCFSILSFLSLSLSVSHPSSSSSTISYFSSSLPPLPQSPTSSATGYDTH